jgi:hypothetical protein
VKEALAFALEHATSPAKWIFPKYKAGLDGYDTWTRALESGNADGQGTAYNAAVWTECQGYAVLFLREAVASYDKNEEDRIWNRRLSREQHSPSWA